MSALTYVETITVFIQISVQPRNKRLHRISTHHDGQKKFNKCPALNKHPPPQRKNRKYFA